MISFTKSLCTHRSLDLPLLHAVRLTSNVTCLPMRTLLMAGNPMLGMLLLTAFPWGSNKAGRGMMSRQRGISWAVNA